MAAEPKPDLETTQQMLARRAPGLAWLPKAIRDRLTPASVWSAVVIIAIGVGNVVDAKRDIERLKERDAETRKNMDEVRDRLDMLNKIDTQIAVLNSKLDDIATEVNRQRERWERVEQVASEPPAIQPHRKRR